MIEEIDHEEIVEPLKDGDDELQDWCDHYDEQEKKNKELFKDL